MVVEGEGRDGRIVGHCWAFIGFEDCGAVLTGQREIAMGCRGRGRIGLVKGG